MIETISDFLSIAVMVGILFFAIYALYAAIVVNREATFKSIERRYYRYYEGVDDEDDSSDRDDLYFEDE
ncbi:MAG: hypothetical protein J6D29_07650 [Solobacterium sp.]|nr:hypothetical protein [Solobacterium sp.]